MGFFNWIRNGVHQACLQGFQDAITDIHTTTPAQIEQPVVLQLGSYQSLPEPDWNDDPTPARSRAKK